MKMLPGIVLGVAAAALGGPIGAVVAACAAGATLALSNAKVKEHEANEKALTAEMKRRGLE